MDIETRKPGFNPPTNRAKNTESNIVFNMRVVLRNKLNKSGRAAMVGQTRPTQCYGA